MRTALLLAFLLVFVAGCCPGITGDRLKEINDQWFKMYTADRRMMDAELAAYLKMSDEEKEAWRKNGQPTDRPLSDRVLQATQDFKNAVDKEAEEAK